MPTDIDTNTEPHGSPFEDFDKTEVTKVVLQSLYDLGYDTVAQRLETDSGLLIDADRVRQLRKHVMAGDWEVCESMLDNVELSEESVDARIYMRFLVRREAFVEKLLEGKTQEALGIMRAKLTPLGDLKRETHSLTPLVMKSPDEVKEELGIEGVDDSRKRLIVELQRHMSTNEVLPENRLGQLLKHARANQYKENAYWFGDEPFTLYKDLDTDRANFPHTVEKVLDAHEDEVWYLSFSHDGKHLASTSQDCTVRIWDTETWEQEMVLFEHSKGTVLAAWSPDDSMLITCSDDHRALLWDLSTQTVLHEVDVHDTIVTGACWLSDNRRYLTGGPDLKLILWDIDGNELYTWRHIRVMSMALTHDDKLLIVLDSKYNVHFIDFEAKETLRTVDVGNECTHVQVSRDSKYAIINVKPEEVHLWNLQTLRIERKFVGQLQKQYIIRSCFGGPLENFILSGSHDAKIYVWSRATGALIETLCGHSANVSSVAWSPTEARTFASASDDCTIKIWKSHAKSKVA